MTAADLRRQVADLLEQLGEDELDVLLLVAGGLAAGRAVYGELRVDADRRDFVREARDEVRDALVYLGAELVRLQRGRR